VKQRFSAVVLALAVAAPFGPVTAAENPPQQNAAAEKPDMVPLKLDLVIVRQAGDKKISSMPYSMWVTANAPSGTRLRMGVQVPIVQTVFGSESKEKGEGTVASVPQRSYTYRDIGANIDASATSASDGRYRVSITLSETGLHEKGEPATGGAPLIRSFSSSFQLLLRDKQTATFSSATDPVTGETLRVDATLTVLK
jgi:hypothetical protein